MGSDYRGILFCKKELNKKSSGQSDAIISKKKNRQNAIV